MGRGLRRPHDESWGADYADPYDFINVLLDGRNIQDQNNTNFAYFNDPSFNSQLDQAATKVGSDRASTYGDIATAMKTDQAPWAAWSNQTNYDFFSARIGCQLWEPSYGIDLATLCIRK